MKKLMVAIAAVASAFGLYATDPIFLSSFETAEEIPPANGWVTDDAEAVFTQKEGNVGAGVYDTGNVRYSFFQGANEKYLGIKTKLDTPVLKTLDAAIDNEAVYFDQLVKFTATDEAQSFVGDTDTKIALYVQDLTESDTPSAATNLYVVAGQYVGGDFSSDHVYDLGPIDVDVWHRVTVKTLKALSGSVGFEVFVDGEAKQYVGESKKAYDGVAGSLEKLAQAMNASSKIFPARVSGLTIEKVGFAGQGEIDDFIATTTSPGTWADDKNFTLAWNADSHLTALKYTVYDEEITVDDLTVGSAVIPWSTGMTVTVAPTFVSTADETWSLDKYDGSGFTAVGNVLTVSSDSTTATILAKETTPRIEMNGQTYPNFKEAIAAITSYPAELTLNKAVPVGVNDLGGTEASFNGDVTIDLNGQVITGTDEDFTGYVIQAVGSLTIVDSSKDQTGAVKVAADTSYAGVVRVMSPSLEKAGLLSIEAGQFDGKVALGVAGDTRCAAESSVSGGKFAYADNKTDDDKFALTCAKGFTANPDAEQDPTYWVVESLPSAKISLTATNATVDGIEDQADAYERDELSFTVEADQYYGDVTVKIGGVVQTPDDGTYTYTVTAADVESKVVTVEVTAAAVEYTLTYTEENEAVQKEETFTAANYTELTLWDGAREGFTFNDDWQNGDFEDVDDTDALLANIKALIDDGAESLDLTLTGTWEVAAVPTFGGGDGSAGNPFVIATKDHLVELQDWVAAGTSFAGQYFQQTANIALTGAWTGIGSKTAPFAGIYDGDNNEITGLKFYVGADKETDDAYNYQGLFKCVTGTPDNQAVIKNLTISMADAAFDTTEAADGIEYGGAAFVGIGQNVKLLNLTAKEGTLQGTHNTAGIAIKLYDNCLVENCTNKMTIGAGYTKASGLVCFVQQEMEDVEPNLYTVTFKDCVNVGTIKATNFGTSEKFSGRDGLAGFVAYVGRSGGVLFQNCESKGTIDTSDAIADVHVCAASFVGYAADSKVISSLGGNTTTLVGIPSVDNHLVKLPVTTTNFNFAVVDEGTATFVADDGLTKDGTEYKVMTSNKVDVVLAVGQSIKFDEALFPAVVKADDPEKNEVTRTQTVGSTYLYTCAAKSVGPQPVNPDDGNVDPDPTDPAGKTFIVTPTEGKASVTLKGADSSMTIKVTSAADFTISGLNGATVKVMCNDVDISGVCVGGTDFSTALDPTKTTPTFTEGESGEEPLVIGENVDVTVSSVAGLAYTLVRGEEVGAITSDIVTVKGTGEAITLEDTDKPAGKAFYKVSVSKAEVK